MTNTPYPYMQASGNQIMEMLETVVNAYTVVTIILAAALLVLLAWLCISELLQSKDRRRVVGSPRPNQPQRTARRGGECEGSAARCGLSSAGGYNRRWEMNHVQHHRH